MSDPGPGPRPDPGAGARPLLWIVTPYIGEPSEIWIIRQILGLTDFDIEVLCWNDVRGPGQLPDLTVHMMGPPHPSRRDEAGAAKWIGRLARAAGRNFLAGTRSETDQIAALAARRKPDVMLCHFGYTALRMRPVADRLNIPQAVHFHGVDLSASLRNRWYRWSVKATLPRIERVIAVGSRQEAWLKDHGVDPARLARIPCGAPVGEFARQRPMPEGPPTFITVSRLSAQKGVDINIRAFAEIAADLPDARLVIVGDGPDRDKLPPLARELGVADRVRFTGSLPPDEVRRELEEATVFLQHSLDHQGWYEGFGVSLTEAMSMEMPSIVSACGGLMDQVTDGETGLVCPQGDVAAVADAMRALAGDQDLARRLGRAARQSALENFDTEKQVAKLNDLLLKAAGRAS